MFRPITSAGASPFFPLQHGLPGAELDFALDPALVDAFAMQAGPEGTSASLAQLALLQRSMVDPAAIQSRLSQFALSEGPMSSRDLGSITPDSKVLIEKLTKLFEQAQRAGGVEARPGSALAEATATGDFSQMSPEQLLAAVLLLAAYMRNPSNASPNQPWGRTGSWGGSRGTNHTGANANAAAPAGPSPIGDAPAGSGSGEKLAHAARQVAGRMGSTGWCYKGVADAVGQALGVQLTGGSAYMAADQLTASGKFKEVSVSPEQLKELPPGAVVVWGKTAESPHGHISVALGNGQEASDHVQSQMTSLRGHRNYRVFMPT